MLYATKFLKEEKNMNDLNRFLDAQNGGIYEQALGEISSGYKRSHWMWFIFPQIKGLGMSPASEFYGINNLEEAKAYLNHPVLGQRLREITQALLDQKSRNLEEIFGWPDCMKLVSSMTLFDQVSPGDLFEQAISEFNNGQKDKSTLEIIAELETKSCPGMK